MKNKRKRRILYIIINLAGLYGVTAFATVTIPVSHDNSCDYTVFLPEGWDVIPADTIKNKLQQQFNFDLGIYPVSQGACFSGNYALIGFMPSNRILTGFTFNQIVETLPTFVFVEIRLCNRPVISKNSRFASG